MAFIRATNKGRTGCRHCATRIRDLTCSRKGISGPCCNKSVAIKSSSNWFRGWGQRMSCWGVQCYTMNYIIACEQVLAFSNNEYIYLYAQACWACSIWWHVCTYCAWTAHAISRLNDHTTKLRTSKAVTPPPSWTCCHFSELWNSQKSTSDIATLQSSSSVASLWSV